MNFNATNPVSTGIIIHLDVPEYSRHFPLIFTSVKLLGLPPQNLDTHVGFSAGTPVHDGGSQGVALGCAGAHGDLGPVARMKLPALGKAQG